MPQTPDAVIEVSLQAACIRAAATMSADARSRHEPSVTRVIAMARSLYREATSLPWDRGDQPVVEKVAQ